MLHTNNPIIKHKAGLLSTQRLWRRLKQLICVGPSILCTMCWPKGRCFRIFNVVDEFKREALAIKST